MRVLLDRLKGFAELLLLAVMLVSWGSSDAVAQFFNSPGGGTGGFTGRPLITVELSADKTSVPVNLAGFGPNPSLPYTSTLTAVVKRDGRLFPTNIQFDLAPNLAQGALFDPADLTKGFRSLPLTSTSGLATAFFQASSTPGTVTITASAQDPNTGQTVSSSVQITVVAEARPATSMTFTGPYVNAVQAGLSRFGDPQIQNGAYSRVVSVVVNDANGNPTNPNTKINFFLIDGPITGYPIHPGSFVIAGAAGDPQEGGLNFSALGGQFLTKGVRPFDRLVLRDAQFRTVQTVTSETNLTIQSTRPFGLENRTAIPYVIGRTENAAILSPSFTDLSGVASTILTYPVTRIGQTAILMACTDDYVSCGVLNTCDVNGANCKSVYLGVTNGTDRTLTTSATDLGPNRITNVQMCLRDPNFTPLPATEIRYDVGSAGPATIKINDVAGSKGALLTGADGCAVVKIASSGQIPGSLPIIIQFTSDYVAVPVPVTIKSPGAGKMDGLFNCEFQFDKATATCKGTLRLTDDEGSPMSGVLIALAPTTPPFPFKLTFVPAEGVFGKTDDQGQTQVTINLDGPGDYSFPFQTAVGGTAKFEFKVTVPKPGTLKVTVVGAATATVGTQYSAIFQADGGIPPYTFSISSGSLPPGLIPSSNGSISGIPTAEGAFSFAVQATDSKKQTGFGAFTITVGAASGGGATEPLKLTLNTLPTATAGTPYSTVLGTASGGKAPYTWSFENRGNLPAGIALSASGVLSGTFGAAGTNNFVVKVADLSSPVQASIANATVTVVSGDGGGGGGTAPTQLTLLVSSPDLPSSGQNPVTLTAIARDSGGVLLKDVTVNFKITNGDGALQVIDGGVTNDSGAATATLSTGGNPRNRIITVGATAGGISANTVNVTVTGTTLSVSGIDPGAAVLVGDTVKLNFELKDSSGAGIPGATLKVSSKLNGLAIPPATSNAQGSTLDVTTNSSGVAEVNLKINQNGKDTIDASWPNSDGTVVQIELNASPDAFTITVEDNATSIADVVGISPVSFGKVAVTWLKSGAAVAGATVKLVTTKGQFSPSDAGSGGTTYTTITNATGKITVDISSTVPGNAVITATGNKGADSVSTQKTFQFVSTTATQLTVQANPATIAVNVPPATSSQSTITATLRDANDNPVANQTVVFSILKDSSGGTLTASVAKTDFSGQASVVYIAGSAATAENGVQIQATVAGLPPGSVNLTVSKREVFITLGTGNTITEPDPTTYALPYNVLVNDIAGGAVQGATVTLNTVPSQYSKGQYVWNGVVWVPVIAVSCPNEDLTYPVGDPRRSNGILDSGEDANSNGRLDPGNVVTTSVAAITTDKDGFGKFDVLYAQQYANWINNTLTARTKVNGSEDEQSSIFVLPPSAADVGNEKVTPPGQPSPFGVLPNCAVSAETETGLALTAASGTVPPGVPANPPNPLSLALGTAAIPDSTLSPGQSVSGTVTVVVNLPNFSGDLTGTSIVTDANAIVANVNITTASILLTTGSQALFTVTVTNPSTTESVPVSATGTTVGSITFAVGSAKAVMSVILKPQP